jgi:hypothetical protein
MSAVFARRTASVAAFATLLAPCLARATDAEVTSDIAAQFYDVRSPTGETVLMRRRVMATLGVGEYNLLNARPGDAKAGELNFRARLRYDADYGIGVAETRASQPQSFVPGLAQGAVDLMYGYLEGRRLLGGWLGFRLGRQYLTDVLGWWSFDGAEASVTTPYYLRAEVYGGLEQRGGLAISSPRFEGDGVWRGNRLGYDPALYPAFQPVNIAPALGVALESTGVTWIHGRLTYRRVNNTASSNTTEFASGLYPPSSVNQWRISSEKIGYAIDASLAKLGGVKGGIVYDLYRSEITSAYASLDVYAGQKVTLSADYDYYVPSFDGDSIWNFFAGEPRSDVGLRGNVDVSDRLSLAANAHARMFTVQTAPFDPGGMQTYSPSTNCISPGPTNTCGIVYPSNGHPFDEGGNVSARWRTGETRIALRGSGDFGDEGDRVGADVSGEHIFETRYVASGRVGAWQWKDKLRPDRATTSAQYVLAAGYRFLPRSRGSVEWEHDINGIAGQRFRVMFVLNIGLGNPGLLK